MGKSLPVAALTVQFACGTRAAAHVCAVCEPIAAPSASTSPASAGLRTLRGPPYSPWARSSSRPPVRKSVVDGPAWHARRATCHLSSFAPQRGGYAGHNPPLPIVGRAVSVDTNAHANRSHNARPSRSNPQHLVLRQSLRSWPTQPSGMLPKVAPTTSGIRERRAMDRAWTRYLSCNSGVIPCLADGEHNVILQPSSLYELVVRSVAIPVSADSRRTGGSDSNASIPSPRRRDSCRSA
jgi:hypothetical protein